MSASVGDYLNYINDQYNQEVFFISGSIPNNRYSTEENLIDLSLHIHFLENNTVTLDGQCVKYCTGVDKHGKAKLAKASSVLKELT